MGVEPELTRGAVRVSLGATTRETDIDRFLNAWISVSGALLNKSRETSRGIAA
jgi:cysteine desulfurase